MTLMRRSLHKLHNQNHPVDIGDDGAAQHCYNHYSNQLLIYSKAFPKPGSHHSRG